MSYFLGRSKNAIGHVSFDGPALQPCVNIQCAHSDCLDGATEWSIMRLDGRSSDSFSEGIISKKSRGKFGKKILATSEVPSKARAEIYCFVLNESFTQDEWKDNAY